MIHDTETKMFTHNQRANNTWEIFKTHNKEKWPTLLICK